MLSEKEHDNDDDSVRCSKQRKKSIMRLIAAHTLCQSSREGSTFDQTPMPSGPNKAGFIAEMGKRYQLLWNSMSMI